jgi:hypothetical protein
MKQTWKVTLGFNDEFEDYFLVHAVDVIRIDSSSVIIDGVQITFNQIDVISFELCRDND